jgi:Na+/H+-dicarboxylate symporter
MNPNWSTLGPLAAVAVSWAAIWWLRKRQLNFSLIALFALAIGVPIGLIAGQHVDAIDPIGRIYINVLLATVGPLILVAIVSSIASLGSLVKLRSIGLRSVFWLLLSNALGVVVAIGLALALQPGKGLGRELGGLSTDTIQGQVQGFGDVVVGFFPTNVVQSFGANEIIPIILIAVTLSVAYLALAEKEPEKTRPFAVGVEALKLVIFKAVGYVIRLTPYAIVALTADMVGSSTNLGDDFRSLGGLLALVWIACLIHAYVVNGALLSAFANVPVVAFFRKVFPAQVTAFSTQSSVGTLPVTTAQLTRKVGVHPEIAHFTAPLGTTIGMPGCAGIWPVLIAVWGINAYGLSYSAADYALLAFLSVIVSVGVAGVPGAATVSAATVMAAANLPLEFVAATISIGVIADMARTATNVTAAAVSSTIVARQTGLLDDEIFAGRKQLVEDAPPLAAPPPGPIAVPPSPLPSPTPAGVPAFPPAAVLPSAAPVAPAAAAPRVFWGATELTYAAASPPSPTPAPPDELQPTRS